MARIQSGLAQYRRGYSAGLQRRSEIDRAQLAEAQWRAAFYGRLLEKAVNELHELRAAQEPTHGR